MTGLRELLVSVMAGISPFGGSTMQLLDSVKCVECGKVEHVRSAGKSSRAFNGVCDACQPKLFPEGSVSGLSKVDVPKGK